MAGKKKAQQGAEHVQDFSSRYPGAQEVDAQRGGWFQFSKIGDELVGQFEGVRPFKNGIKGTMRRQSGELVVFSVPTLLQDLLREVKVGERIAIVLSGFQPTNQDSPMKVYQVFRVPSGR